jgi:hypothetical protein
MWFPNRLGVELRQLGDLGDGEELVHERNRTHHGRWLNAGAMELPACRPTARRAELSSMRRQRRRNLRVALERLLVYFGLWPDESEPISST